MLYKTLNNGVVMPQLGFGVYKIRDEAACEQAVSDALAVGYRSIDTAAIYANERAVGRALASSDVPRAELFITSKLWVSDVSYDGARRGLAGTLDRLGLDYLDLFLIHQPYGDVHGAWRAMEDMVDEGLIRAIGVANFHPDRLADIISFNRMAPAVNQIECHPYFQQGEAQAYMESRGVTMESWAPFGEGREGMFEQPVLAEIGRAHGKSVAQVILRWQLQRGIVCIPKSVHRERMEQNFDVFDFELTEEEMARIAALDRDETFFFDHRDPAQVERQSKRILDV